MAALLDVGVVGVEDVGVPMLLLFPECVLALVERNNNENEKTFHQHRDERVGVRTCVRARGCLCVEWSSVRVTPRSLFFPLSLALFTKSSSSAAAGSTRTRRKNKFLT